MMGEYPMASRYSNHIRAGGAALAVSSGLFLVAELLHPAAIDPSVSPTEFAVAATTTSSIISHILFIPSAALVPFGALALYMSLRESPADRTAFAALILNLLGGGLFIPVYGIATYTVPVASKLYLQGDPGALGVYLGTIGVPWFAILPVGGILLAASTVVFAVAAWRSGMFPKLPPLLYAAGYVLFMVQENQLPKLGVALVGLLIGVGGLWLAQALWQRAIPNA